MSRAAPEPIRDQVAHIARGCRSGLSHNPAVYEQEIDAGLDAVRAVVERYGRVWAKDTDYYRAAEALGIKEPPDPCAEAGRHVCGPDDGALVLGHCPHGVNLDQDICPEGCRV